MPRPTLFSHKSLSPSSPWRDRRPPGAILLLLLLSLGFSLGLCPGRPAPPLAALSWWKKEPERQRFERTFYDYFDTVCQIQGFAASEEDFQEVTDPIVEDLRTCHELFTRHEGYAGLHNLYYLNEHAGEGPIEVDPLLFDLLERSLHYYDVSGGAFHPGLGGATLRWEEARAEEKPPRQDELDRFLPHLDPRNLVLDEDEGTVRYKDPLFQLDLGAVAKGYAAEYAASRAEARGDSGLLLNLGGNIRTIGHRDGSPLTDETDEAWRIGVRDPRGDREDAIVAFSLLEGSFVTSGDYERSFTYEGEFYPHILNPETLWPVTTYRSVTIFHEDSGVADFLSTALFNLSPEEGKALLQKVGGEAFWILRDGSELETQGMTALR